MLPKQEKYGLWPASGEIDIVESRGNANLRDNTGKPIGNNWMGSTLHWGPFFAANSLSKISIDQDFLIVSVLPPVGRSHPLSTSMRWNGMKMESRLMLMVKKS